MSKPSNFNLAKLRAKHVNGGGQAQQINLLDQVLILYISVYSDTVYCTFFTFSTVLLLSGTVWVNLPDHDRWNMVFAHSLALVVTDSPHSPQGSANIGECLLILLYLFDWTVQVQLRQRMSPSPKLPFLCFTGELSQQHLHETLRVQYGPVQSLDNSAIHRIHMVYHGIHLLSTAIPTPSCSSPACGNLLHALRTALLKRSQPALLLRPDLCCSLFSQSPH